MRQTKSSVLDQSILRSIDFGSLSMATVSLSGPGEPELGVRDDLDGIILFRFTPPG